MNFARPIRKERRESIVPMINVVFLLLVFLLLTAELAPPEPFEVAPPTAQTEGEATTEVVLHISADGALALGTARGEAALLAIPEGGVLYVRADATLPAARLAALLPRLGSAGEVRLITVAP